MQRTANRAPIEFLRVFERDVALQAGPGLDNRFALIDALEQRAHKRLRRELASTEPAHELDGGQCMQSTSGHAPDAALNTQAISCRASADAS